MVTIAEAIEQVQTSEEEAAKRESEIRRAEARARKIRVGGSLAEQFQFGASLPKARKQARQQRTEVLQQIGSAKQELAGFKESLVERKGEIASAQVAQAAALKYNEDLAVARTLAAKGVRGEVLASQESKRIQKLVAEIRKGLAPREQRVEQIVTAKELGLTPLFVDGKLTGFESETQSIALKDLGEAYPEAVQPLVDVGLISVEKTTAPSKFELPLAFQMSYNPKVTPPTKAEKFVRDIAMINAELVPLPPYLPGKLRDYNVPSFLEPYIEPESITEFRAGIGYSLVPKTGKELAITGATFGAGALIGGGLKLSGLGLKAIGGLRTVKIAEGITGVAGIGLGGLFAYETGKQVIETPDVFGKGVVIGESARGLVVFGAGAKLGSKGATAIGDIIRTKGLTEISTESVIAPEYFKGQTYPAIKPGQTAGQLRKEFFEPISALDEFKTGPRFFTALSTEPLAELPKGNSFVFGGFGAPRGSPKFFRIGSEETAPKLFSFSGLMEVGEPTLARTTFLDIGFAPGITAGTRQPTGRVNERLLRFFGGGFSERTGKLVAEFKEPKAPKGFAFIPFVKTEKEAVGIFGTKVIETQRKFFFKFGGRRVIVPQLQAIGEGGIKKTGNEFFDAKILGDVLKSYSPIPRKSLITPEVGGVNLGSFRSIKIKSSSLSLPSIKDISSSSSRISRRRLSSLNRYLSPSQKPPSPRSSGGISRRGISSSLSFLPSSSSLPSSGRRPSTSLSPGSSSMFSLPERIRIDRIISEKTRRKEGRNIGKKIKSKGKRFVGKLAPSFTAQVLDIRGSLPKEIKLGKAEFGVLPGRIRKIPV